MSENNHSSECACCTTARGGPNPIDTMIKERGMAIVQIDEPPASPFYYSVGVSGGCDQRVEFFMAGLEPECVNSTIGKLAELYKQTPKLFAKNGAIPKVIKITNKQGTIVNANAYIRTITDEAYITCCGQLQARYGKRIRVLQVFIPDTEGRAFNHPQYDKHLRHIQCPFISGN